MQKLDLMVNLGEEHVVVQASEWSTKFLVHRDLSELRELSPKSSKNHILGHSIFSLEWPSLVGLHP